MNELQHEQYGRALVDFASLAVKDPRLSILVAELDFVASAIPANATAWAARKRVDDLISPEEDRLKAVVSDARTLKTHIDDRNRLIGERARILASVRPGH